MQTPATGIMMYMRHAGHLVTVSLELAVDTKKLDKEKQLQQTMLDIKQKYGKNAVLKGTSYMSGATMRERNEQIGGHKAK